LGFVIPAIFEYGLRRQRDDVDSGEWDRRQGSLTLLVATS
jgi:hypothetical protein